MTVESFAALADRIRRRPPGLGPVRLVAVDGPSGAGKTDFAARLARALGAAPVVHTDDLLDGWADQFTFWQRLERSVLVPLRAGRVARYRRYQWHRDRFGGAPVQVPPAPVVLLEGVSAARAEIRPEVSLAVFVTAPPDECLRRAVERDGAAVLPYLQRWRVAEAAHFAADRTVEHAGLIVDGAPRVVHDASTRYVRLMPVDDRA